MFITKEEIKSELKDEECYLNLSPKEKKFLLEYLTNGLQGTTAYLEVYTDNQRVIKFPGKKANEIIAKPDFQDCFNLYSDIIRKIAPDKVNAQLFNLFWHQAFYNVFDFIKRDGSFKFDTIEDAKEQLGMKAMAIQGIETVMHPRDPNKTMTMVKFINRDKAAKEISKYTKFLGEETGAGSGMGQVVIKAEMQPFDPSEDDRRRKEFNLV